METPEKAIMYGPVDAGLDMPVPVRFTKKKAAYWTFGVLLTIAAGCGIAMLPPPALASMN